MNSFVFQDRKMTVKKMQKIGVKRTKRNNTICKEKLKRQKFEKKLEDEDSDYLPNILDARFRKMKGMYLTKNLLLKLLLFWMRLRYLILAILLLMECKAAIKLLMECKTLHLLSTTPIILIIATILFLHLQIHLLQ
jgi:hypothetical protein